MAVILNAMRLIRWALIPLILALGACAAFKRDIPDDDHEKSKVPEGPELVGRVASIAADRRFVLIQSYGTWKQETDAILTTRGAEERTANLLVTGEALGQFAAADIQSGTVEIGDAVYSRHIPKPAEPDPAPDSKPEVKDSQWIEETGNVQKNN